MHTAHCTLIGKVVTLLRIRGTFFRYILNFKNCHRPHRFWMTVTVTCGCVVMLLHHHRCPPFDRQTHLRIKPCFSNLLPHSVFRSTRWVITTGIITLFCESEKAAFQKGNYRISASFHRTPPSGSFRTWEEMEMQDHSQPRIGLDTTTPPHRTPTPPCTRCCNIEQPIDSESEVLETVVNIMKTSQS